MFNRNKEDIVLATKHNNLAKDIKNWYSERYENALIQRNILFIIVLVSIFTITAGLIIIKHIAENKTIEPFVIEVEKKTGITNVVNPANRIDLTTNEALNTYFIIKYLRARETYNIVDYQYNYSTLVRLFSTNAIYFPFRTFVNDNPRSPVRMYGTHISSDLKIRSIQFISSSGENKAQVRFTIIENGGQNREFNKIATINFNYVQMEMNTEERYVNPLGFQVTGYRVDDEVL